MLSVKSMIELRKLHSNKDGEVINLLGYKEGGVSGGGFFYWDERNTEIDDGGCTIKVNDIEIGRWVRKLTNYINYSMYGADETGKEYSDDEMYRAHMKANSLRIPVIQNSGNFLWKSKTLPVYESCDLTGSIIMCDSKSGSETPTYNSPVIYDIKPKKKSVFLSPEDISELNKNYIQYMIKNSMFLPFSAISKYKNALIIFESDTIDMTRNNGGEISYNKKKDMIVTTRDGGLSIGFVRDFIDENNTGDVKNVQIIPAEDSVLYFKSPQINCNSTVSVRFIRCNRSNTIIDGVVHIESGKPVNNIRSMINVEKCNNVTLKNFEVEAIPRVDSTIGTYGFQFSLCTRLNLTNITGNDGWGIIGSNYLKNVTLSDSFLNRFDCHWMAYNIIIENTTFKNLGVYLTGGGCFIARNCTYVLDRDGFTFPSVTPNYTFFNPRADYGQEWDGTILIDGLTIRISEQAKVNRVCCVKFTPINYDTGRSVVWPTSIVVKNIFVEGANSTFDGYFQSIAVYIASKCNYNRKILCPCNITVSGMYISKVKVPSFSTAVTWYDFGDSSALARENNLQFNTLKTNTNISVSEIYSQPLDSVNLTNDGAGVIQIIERVAECNQKWYNDKNRMALLFNIKITACETAFINFTAIGRLSISSSSVTSIDNYATGEFESCIISVNDCVISPVSRSNKKNQWLLGNKKTLFINCEFTSPLQFDGVHSTHVLTNELYGVDSLKGFGNYTDNESIYMSYGSWTPFPNNFWSLSKLG